MNKTRKISGIVGHVINGRDVATIGRAVNYNADVLDELYEEIKELKEEIRKLKNKVYSEEELQEQLENEKELEGE